MMSFLFDNSFIRGLIRTLEQGYLHEVGWLRSILEEKPIDRHGSAVPWFSYPFFYFLDERLRKGLSVFEYGSGQSTFYYAQKGIRVSSVEHNAAWLPEVPAAYRDKVQVHFIEDIAQYAKSILEFKARFDIVVVDGIERVACLRESLAALHEHGVLVLDDSQRSEYEEGIRYLRAQGFKVLHFWGMKPMGYDLTSTTLFYRETNCLGV